MKTTVIEGVAHFPAVMAFNEDSRDPFWKYSQFTDESRKRFNTLFVELPKFIDLHTGEVVDSEEQSLIQLSITTRIEGFIKFFIPLEHYDAFMAWAKQQNLQEGPAHRGQNKTLDAIFDKLENT